MKLPHQMEWDGARWTFTWDGWGRSGAPAKSGTRFDESDIVFIRFESSDGRFGVIVVPHPELEALGDDALMERIPLAQRQRPSPDEGV